MNALPDINRNACILDPDGNAAPINGIPLNTVQVDTGFPDPAMTIALVSDLTFDGRPSRLQLPTTATRELRNQNDIWDVDNVGPWKFLTEASPIVQCQGSTYTPLLDTDAKIARFETYISDPAIGEVFSSTITSSARFV